MRRLLIVGLIFLGFALPALAQEEGTRHITGSTVDLYFMNDKLFGTVAGQPIWSIYNCGESIKGEIDVKGTYQSFDFVYHQEGEKKVTGKFGERDMSLGKMEKKDEKILYHIFSGDQEYLFTIAYEKMEEGHLVNSIIEGELADGKKVKLTADGHLCPFATTGIILLCAGALTL